MSDSKMNEYLEASFEGIRRVADMDTVIGKPINTPSGVTVIPISKITMGFATGGLDYGAKKFTPAHNSGAGGGTGVTITPLGFLTVSPSADVKLVPLADSVSSIDKVASLIEHAPELISRIKDSLS